MSIFLICISLLFSTQAFAMDSYADLVEKLITSVVNISTEKEVIDDNGGTINNMLLNYFA